MAASSFFFSSSSFFFFSSAAGLASAVGAEVGAAAGAAATGASVVADLSASSMLTSDRDATNAFTLIGSAFIPAAVKTWVMFSSLTGFPALCRRMAACTYSKLN